MSIRWALVLLGIVAGGVLCACGDPQKGEGATEAEAPCQPGAMLLTEERGRVRDVTNDPPCRLVFKPTGVRLTGTGDGAHPDPGKLVVRDGRGRYYSTNAEGWPVTVSVWDSAGDYLTKLGGPGDGPGEFPGNYLYLMVGAGDTLHVVDMAHWSFFSPDHKYVRRVSSRLVGREPETTVILYDGKVLTSDGSVPRAGRTSRP